MAGWRDHFGQFALDDNNHDWGLALDNRPIAQDSAINLPVLRKIRRQRGSRGSRASIHPLCHRSFVFHSGGKRISTSTSTL
jgi:hypothetical protein